MVSADVQGVVTFKVRGRAGAGQQPRSAGPPLGAGAGSGGSTSSGWGEHPTLQMVRPRHREVPLSREETLDSNGGAARPAGDAWETENPRARWQIGGRGVRPARRAFGGSAILCPDRWWPQGRLGSAALGP